MRFPHACTLPGNPSLSVCLYYTVPEKKLLWAKKAVSPKIGETVEIHQILRKIKFLS